jgi:hypothetical protein
MVTVTSSRREGVNRERKEKRTWESAIGEHWVFVRCFGGVWEAKAR